eukprot:sb/3477615/
MSLNWGPTKHVRKNNESYPALFLNSMLDTVNRPNQEMLALDWLITSHVTSITSSDWLFTCFGRFLSGALPTKPSIFSSLFRKVGFFSLPRSMPEGHWPRMMFLARTC